MTPHEAHRKLMHLCEAGEFARAVKLAEQAVQSHPRIAAFWHILGAAHAELNAFEGAAMAFQSALALNPADLDALFNLGCALQRMGRVKEAIDVFSDVVAQQPRHVAALTNMGNMMQLAGRLPEALEALQKAVAQAPDHSDTLLNLASALQQSGEIEDALTVLGKILSQDPDHTQALGLVLRIKGDIGDFSRFADFTRVKETLGITTAALPPFLFLHLEDHPGRLQQRVKAWTANRYPSPAMPAFLKTDRDTIRVGYFSVNFHDHPNLYLTSGLFEHHDAARFEVNAYSMGQPRPSKARDRIVPHFAAFNDVHALSDAKIAQVARQQGLDIAIDLDGHIRGNRPGVLAHRAAPVQVGFLGFPGPLVLPFVDYMIADDVTVPAGQRGHHDAALAFMPGTYQPTDRARRVSTSTPARRDHGLPDDRMVFCCFNTCTKIDPRVFDIWMRVLRKVEGSVLWLLAGHPMMITNLRAEAAARGVDPSRLVFAPKIAQADHIARLGLADLSLDTFFYNAHTTASDALWAGVPVVTMPGAQFSARVAASLLTAQEMPELIAQTEAEYEAIALALACDPDKRAALKAKLKQKNQTAQLFDTLRFTRAFEALLIEMHKRRCKGAHPTDIRLH